ncbi:hypothetical protein [Actinocorallia libanotica]|uniref:Lipoprotein n=1 Tax=Actinocorallia libanotica TaxID=46162 RepID=A0ABP4CGR1_9ACTN
MVAIVLMFTAACGAENAPASAEFCAVAEKFTIEGSGHWETGERVNALRQLSQLGPKSLRNDFDYLLELEAGHSLDDSTDFDGALARTGGYMERQCDINLPGIRTDRGST